MFPKGICKLMNACDLKIQQNHACKRNIVLKKKKRTECTDACGKVYDHRV